jgi:thioredoxin-dependent peroxiredoxin
MPRKTLLIMMNLAVLAIGGLMLHSSAAAPAPGSAAPQFTLNSQEQHPVKLADFKGKWVVLYFYPKDMTPGCTIEAHNFERDQAKYTANNAVVLGVSLDDEKSHKEFCTKESLTFKLLADTTGKVTKEYGSLNASGQYAERNTFVISPDGKIAKVFTAVDPNKHSEEVLTVLAELQKK